MSRLAKYEYNGASLLIFWGDAHTSFCKSEPLSTTFPFIKEHLGSNTIPFFVNQKHGNNGVVINESTNPADIMDIEADFLITNQPHRALSIVTADCTPLILIDPHSHAIGIAHAGWRGTLLSVIQQMIKAMCATYQTEPTELHAFFGPSAQVCCYEIKEDVVHQLATHSLAQQHLNETIIHQNNRIFFNLKKLQTEILIAQGLQTTNIDITHAECTICNHHYCSYRRNKGSDKRNITSIMIKKGPII